MYMFSPEDFSNKEIKDKLHTITLSKMGKYPLTPFESLSFKEKRVANDILNTYIHHLPPLREDWHAKLTRDFNIVCEEEIFNHPKIDYTQALFKQKPIEDYPIVEDDKLTIIK